MAHLILPSRRIVQPPGAVEVDWGNPLASGLVLCASLPHKIDFVTGKQFSTNEVGASNRVIASKYSASSAPVRYSAPYNLSAGSDFSLVSIISKYVTGGSNPGLWREGATSSGSTFTIFQGGSGLPWIRLNGVNILQPSSGLTINASSGAYNTVAFLVRSATDAAAFFNGVKAHSASHTTATPSCGFYNFGWQLGEYCGDIAGVWLFNRALSDYDLCNLTTNPWQIFKPVQRRIWFDMGAASGGAAVLEGSASGAASASGSLTTGIPIAGAALSVASASGSLAVGIPLAGAAASMTTAAGTLTTQITLAGAALAQAVSSALLSSGITMTAAAVAQAAADGTLVTAIQLLGGAQAQAGATGSLTTSTGGLEGNAQASASASASLTAQILLSGSALAAAAASGSLAGATANLAGAAVSIATASGELTVNVALTAQALASAIAQGSLTAQIMLDADAAAQAQAGAELSGGSALVVVRGAVTADRFVGVMKADRFVGPVIARII